MIDHNVGAGVITDGRLLHAGSSSLVGSVIPRSIPMASDATAVTTVARDYRQRRKRAGAGPGANDEINEFDAASAAVERGWLCRAALQGDLLARDIISGVGQHVGRILAIMVNLFNPQKSSSARRLVWRPISYFPPFQIVFGSNPCLPTAGILPLKARSFLTVERWPAQRW